jgi:hypothetical protein
MAGGTRLHRWIYEASLGRDERSIRFRKEENEPPAVRKVSVSLDRADKVIEGGPTGKSNAKGQTTRQFFRPESLSYPTSQFHADDLTDAVLYVWLQ